MVNKKSKEVSEKLGLTGFILGLFSLSMIPTLILLILFGPGLTGALVGIVGLIFCLVQQKKKKTRLGKIGLTLNIIGIVIGIIALIVMIYYLIPLIEQVI